MLALRAGGDLHPFPQQVEALGDVRVVRTAHVVEGPHVGRVFGDEDELVLVLAQDVFAEHLLTLGVEVTLLGVGGGARARACG